MGIHIDIVHEIGLTACGMYFFFEEVLSENIFVEGGLRGRPPLYNGVGESVFLEGLAEGTGIVCIHPVNMVH